MPKIEKNGVIKIVSEGTLKVLGDNLDGWIIVRDNIKNYTAKKKFNPINTPDQKEKAEEKKDVDLSEDSLKSKLNEAGVKFHHKTGLKKLKKLYIDEVLNNKE